MSKSIEINHPWNAIHRTGGYPSDELVPGFFEALNLFRAHDCRRVLDLGCGSGRHTVGLELEGFETVGLDIAPSGLRITQRKLNTGLLPSRLVLGDFWFPLPFSSGSFDAVISTQVIHHARLAQVRLAIAEIGRVLRPGGLIFVSVGGKRGPDRAEEIEPGTIIPCEGLEAGLPHHIFSVEEAWAEFGMFQIMDVSSRDNGRVILITGQK